MQGDYSVKPDLSDYTHVRLFHGCRPVDVRSYYNNGIVVTSLAELTRQFRAIFSEYPPATIDHAISQVKRRDDEWRVDTVLDLRFMLKHASHYVVQGSETLKELAVHLPWIGGTDPRDRLRSVGRPTALVVEAPMTEIDHQTLQELDEKLALLATGGVYEACDGGDLIDFAVSFRRGVPAAWIVEHRNIDEATDPDDRSRQYRYLE